MSILWEFRALFQEFISQESISALSPQCVLKCDQYHHIIFSNSKIRNPPLAKKSWTVFAMNVLYLLVKNIQQWKILNDEAVPFISFISFMAK